jgi:multiple antibiotic resistance protein
MTSGLLTSFATFFATIGPVEAAVLFATLTPHVARPDRTRLAVKATLIASFILLMATLFGGPVLRQLGVSLPALQTAGGIILLLISLDMIFARPSSAFKLTPTEGAEAQTKDDLAVFPIATPLLAGPGAMSAAIVLAATAHGDATELGLVIAALAAVMTVVVALLIAAHEISHVLGVTAQRVLVRVFGILLSSIAVQAVFNGIGASGLLPPH